MLKTLKHLAPLTMPTLSMILADIGHPTPRAVATLLGVDHRTVRRWIAAGQAPRAVMLALFWLTRWGRSQVDCQATNECLHALATLAATRSVLLATKTQNAHLMRVGVFGSSNLPQYGL